MILKNWANKHDNILQNRTELSNKEKKLDLILNHIYNQGILKDNGIIILHRHKKMNEVFPTKFKVLDERKYGISKIIFISL